MTEIILRELSSSDIDWMTETGRRLEVTAGKHLLEADADLGAFHLILDGEFGLFTESGSLKQPLATYCSGDVFGLFFLLSRPSLAFAVTALKPSLVLSIPPEPLAEKLRQDAGFSARFYRAIAMLLSRKQWQITSELPKGATAQSDLVMTKAILSVFSCLHDSDMCWMTGAGSVKRLRADEVYIREGQPLDALDIVLQGSLSLSICEEKRSALALAFGTPRSSQPRTIAQALPGEVLGVTAFLDMTPNLYRLKATQETRVLSIPIPALMPKLQQDVGFASRFYQALASLTAERLFQILSRLGSSGKEYEPGCSLCDESEYEGELDIQALQQLSLARARFNWMLQQLGVKDRA
ncbi:cyclic nucleotide-binding domain-containing protein [Phormidium tenue FACHB-886]|nr:cyclic nucleotide-binding domain-containing protein [Phormidium tenue FACHB-886]